MIFGKLCKEILARSQEHKAGLCPASGDISLATLVALGNLPTIEGRAIGKLLGDFAAWRSITSTDSEIEEVQALTPAALVAFDRLLEALDSGEVGVRELELRLEPFRQPVND